MALPASGAISLNAVNVEIGNSATATISMNDADVRTLFDDASGTISMSQGHGKSWWTANAASGGTVATYSNYKSHTFTSSGTFTVTTAGSDAIDYLVVVGGGGGGAAGGGGAGGMVTGSGNLSATSYTITIGAGGTGGRGGGGGTNSTNGGSGGIGTVQGANGGGAGGNSNSGDSNIGDSGGSGGGGNSYGAGNNNGG